MSLKKYELYLQVIGHAFFLVLILMSIVFYQERMIAFDSGYYAMKLLIHDDFYIAHQRTISYLSQWLPLLGLKAGVSLKTFLILFSLSFMLTYYLIYNIIVYVFKNPAAGVYMALSLCLLMRHKYFVAVSETPSTIALAALFVGWQTKDMKKFPHLSPWQNTFIGIFLVALLFSGHPMILMPVLIFLGFDLIYHKKWKDVHHWSVIGGTLLVFIFRFASMNMWYEGEKISVLGDGPTILMNLEDYYITTVVQRYFEMEFHIPAILFLILVAVLFYQKRWLSALFMLSTSLLLLAIITISCSYLNSPIYNLIDGYFGYLGMAWSILILYVLIKNNTYRRLSIGIIVCLLAFSTHRIYTKKDFFRNRLDTLSTLMNEHKTENKRKFLLHSKYYSWDKMWYPWAIAFETLLLSADQNPEDATTIYIRRWGDNFVENLKDKEDSFFGANFNHSEYLLEELPTKYFQLKKGKYHYIEPK